MALMITSAVASTVCLANLVGIVRVLQEQLAMKSVETVFSWEMKHVTMPLKTKKAVKSLVRGTEKAGFAWVGTKQQSLNAIQYVEMGSL